MDVEEFVDNLPGWLTPHEGRFLERAVHSLNGVDGTIVEIGSFLGKSTIHLAQGRECVYAVDPHEGIVSGGKLKPTLKKFLANVKQAGVSDLVKPIVQTSASAAVSWDKPIKFLFIDGLHDYDHARQDVTLWSPFVIDGGIIAMHDAFCGWEGAGRAAMEQLVNSEEYGEIGVVGSIVYGVKKKSFGVSKIIKVFRSKVIDLCNRIYVSKKIPKRIQFILVHRMLKLLLLNYLH